MLCYFLARWKGISQNPGFPYASFKANSRDNGRQKRRSARLKGGLDKPVSAAVGLLIIGKIGGNSSMPFLEA
jgi:hypothetical protein